MTKEVYLKKWKYDGDLVKIDYQDDSTLYVDRERFDQAFGPIISATKDVVERDFALHE